VQKERFGMQRHGRAARPTSRPMPRLAPTTAIHLFFISFCGLGAMLLTVRRCAGAARRREGGLVLCNSSALLRSNPCCRQDVMCGLCQRQFVW
jgi:hypothetical protein